MERWAEIPNYEGKYFISDHGRVKNQNGLIMKPMLCSNGYLSACLWENNHQQKLLIHRLVAEVFLSNPNGLIEVNHKDENKQNNRADNLEWCSHSYNMNYGSVKQKISDSNKGKIISSAHREKLGMASRGRIWLNNNIQEILVKKDQVPSFLFAGWNKGRLKNV